MIRNRTASFPKQSLFLSISINKLSSSFRYFFFLLYLILVSCSPTKRFTEKEESSNKIESKEEENNTAVEKSNNESNLNEIRVSMQGLVNSESILIESDVNLFNDQEKIETVKAGSRIDCYESNGNIRLEINDQNYQSEIFFLVPTNGEEIIKLNGKKFRCKIQISLANSSIHIINVLNIEDYVKGVLSKEMPLGKNDENLEALKAQAICIRTYAVQKIKDGKLSFDIFADTRDQVYGGVDAETPISNKAAIETENLILKYEDNPAIIFYHSTCGGFTESSINVFTKEQLPYLMSIEDGNEPNCKISPRFTWKESYSKELFIERLKNYSLLDNQNYSLRDISISSRFSSGRVNELEISIQNEYGEDQSVTIRGNEIRRIIRTADGKSILWSTLFDVSVNSNTIIISGKGYGHGVGLCQWGAIALSRKGWNYAEILDHYFSGTSVEKIHD